MKQIAAFALALCLGAQPAYATDPANQVIGSIEQLGVNITPPDRTLIAQQVTSAAQAAEDPEWFHNSAARLGDMAALTQSALRPSARIRLTEMHRQLLALMITTDNRALDLVGQADPMIHPVEPGIGMTQSDLSWAVMLEAMRQDLPDDPKELTLTNDQIKLLTDQIIRTFQKEPTGAKHFLAHLDAWAFGVISAWPELTPEERKIAVSVVTEAVIPPEPLMTKIIGAQDVLYWLAGIDVGLTQSELDAYPQLASYLSDGYMAGSIADLLAKRVTMMGDKAAQAATLNMMMDLNHDLLFDNSLAAGGLIGME